MIAKPLFSMLVCFSSTLMLAGAAQAQGLSGFPFLSPYNPQPRQAAPCGWNGGPVNLNYGYAPRTNGAGGACNVSGYGYSSNCSSRGSGLTNGSCGAGGCSTGACAGGCVPPRGSFGQYVPNNGGMRTMPRDYGYSNRTLPMPPVPPREYNSKRPAYYSDELPARVAPPAYLDPRSNPYYGASRGERYDTAAFDRSRSRFDSDRSPFYP